MREKSFTERIKREYGHFQVMSVNTFATINNAISQRLHQHRMTCQNPKLSSISMEIFVAVILNEKHTATKHTQKEKI